jgi:hypothetical protein
VVTFEGNRINPVMSLPIHIKWSLKNEIAFGILGLVLVTSCQPPPTIFTTIGGRSCVCHGFGWRPVQELTGPCRLLERTHNQTITVLRSFKTPLLSDCHTRGGGTQHPVGAQNRSVIPVRFPSPEVVEESIHRSFCHEVVTQPAQGKTLRMPGPGFRCSAGVPSEFILASPNPLWLFRFSTRNPEAPKFLKIRKNDEPFLAVNVPKNLRGKNGRYQAHQGYGEIWWDMVVSLIKMSEILNSKVL